jgi:hypothetical protein
MINHSLVGETEMTISMISSRINSPRSTAAVNNSEEKRSAKRHERERHEEIPERLENENSVLIKSKTAARRKPTTVVTLLECDHRKEAVCLVCGWKKEFDDFLRTCLSVFCCATAASVSADASAA